MAKNVDGQGEEISPDLISPCTQSFTATFKYFIKHKNNKIDKTGFGSLELEIRTWTGNRFVTFGRP